MERQFYFRNCYEWDVWARQFEEFKLTGCKIEVLPGIPFGATESFHIKKGISIGTSTLPILSPNAAAVNVLYNSQDYKMYKPDPSLGIKRYYKPA